MNSDLPKSQIVLENSEPSEKLKAEILDDLTIAECSLPAMLALESVVSRGELTVDTQPGTVLYVTAMSPPYLNSAMPSRITYLSKLFKQWQGEISFSLYVTKAIFQQTKLLLVFVPGATPAQVRNTQVEALMGYQIRTVMNPDNETVATIHIPFVNVSPWQHMTGSTGSFAVILLEKIVVTQQTNSTIPWILTCFSRPGPNQIRFRYSVVPPVEQEQPADPDRPEVSKASGIGTLYAASSSMRKRAFYTVDSGAVNSHQLYVNAPGIGTPSGLTQGIAIPLNNSLTPNQLAQRLVHLPLAPPFSFVMDVPVAMKTVVPYLPTITNLYGPLANLSGGWDVSFDWYYTSSNNQTENNCIYFGANQRDIFFVIGLPEHIVNSFQGWKVVMVYHDNNNKTQMIYFTCGREKAHQLRLNYTGQTAPGAFSGIGVRTNTPIFFLDDPVNYLTDNAGKYSTAFLTAQIELARATAPAPYIMLYVQGSKTCAESIRDFLLQPWGGAENWNRLKMLSGNRVAFSCSQAGQCYDMIEKEGMRGLFTWIFHLFSGNDDSPWFKVARITDLIFEFALPLLISYDGEPAPIDLSEISFVFDSVEIGRARLSSHNVRLLEPSSAETGFRSLGAMPEATDRRHHGLLRNLRRRKHESPTYAEVAARSLPASDRE